MFTSSNKMVMSIDSFEHQKKQFVVSSGFKLDLFEISQESPEKGMNFYSCFG